MAEQPKHVLRFFFEWGGGCLWAGNDAARADFDVGPLDLPPTPLPLSDGTLKLCVDLSAWWYTSLNQDYPPDPGPWSRADYERFSAAALELLAAIRRDLGEAFEVIDERIEATESPHARS